MKFLVFPFIFYIFNVPLTVENLRKELLKKNVLAREIVLAQAVLETGWFESYNCKKRNNIFGLWNSNRQEYFEFNSWQECVTAYKNMIQYRLKRDEHYYDFLNRIGYASDPNYKHKLKSIVKKL